MKIEVLENPVKSVVQNPRKTLGFRRFFLLIRKLQISKALVCIVEMPSKPRRRTFGQES